MDKCFFPTLKQQELQQQINKTYVILTKNKTMHTVGQKILKKSRPKKLVKSNKSISRIIYLAEFQFFNFQNGQKSIFELGKSLKLPKMQFHEIFFLFIDFTSFFAWTFLNFLARCEIFGIYVIKTI